MAEISFVKVDIAGLVMEYANLGGAAATDADVARWTRGLVGALVKRDPNAHPYAAVLLGEAEAFRVADAMRKLRAKEDAAKKRDKESKDSKENADSYYRTTNQTDQPLREDKNGFAGSLSKESLESEESAHRETAPPKADTESGFSSSLGARPKTKKAHKTAERFIPPTLDEVRDYCSSRNNGIDPLAFMAHYASNGWKVGKNPVVKWKACVITWEQQTGRYGGAQAPGVSRGGPLV